MRKLKDSGVEWIGEIPTDWSIGRIKYNFYLKGRIGWQGLKADEFVDNGPFLVTGTDFENGNVNWSKCYHISEERYMEAPEIHVENGDLLVTKDGTVGKVAYINNKPEKVSLNSHLLLIRPNSQLYYNKFLFWVIQSPIFDKYFSLSQNGTIMASLSQEKINNFSFPLPGIETQQCIADYLDRKCSQIDAIIARQQEVIEKLKAYKLSVITEAVTKGLNPDVPMKDSGVEWIGEIPEHWDILKLQAHTRMLTPMRDRPEKLDGDIPWVRIEDYDGKYISTSKEGLGVSTETVKEMNLKIYPVGSILCTSSCDLGKCAIVARELVSNQRFINIIPDSNTNSDYLYYLMLSNAERLNHLSTGTIQANLSRKAFEHLMVQFPPISEQKAIAEYLDRKCEAVELSINKKKKLVDRLSSYKKSHIYEVVTGKKEV